MNVARAMVRLGRWLKSKGAHVRYLIVPRELNGTPTKGADDFFAAGGTLEALSAHAITTEPDTETADDTFSDSRLAETIADEVMADRFLWCKALGWLQWRQTHWATTTDETVGEAVRRYTLRRFRDVVLAGKKPAIEGWQTMLGATRQRIVLTLAKGIVEHVADQFDSDPDLLNTPAGVVNLRTSKVIDHDPDLLLTKITRGSYRAGFTHSDWQMALGALPPDVTNWLQVRVGQAVTGHPTPDGVIPILQGSGENGKTAITSNGITPAFGDYAAPVSPKLVTSAKDEHSTERADLRGQRFLIAEELTEDRALNVTAIKQITDVHAIKARLVFRDNFTFPASHSLFMTTNYLPVVAETDHGTWRRFALVTFPFTFRKPNEPLLAPTDRRGDQDLKRRLLVGATGQHDAIVTWGVDGARGYYAFGFPPVPATVETDTRSWRKLADRILGFWDECLVAAPHACVLAIDLLAEFNSWLENNGHRPWSKERFHPLFQAHAETQRLRVHQRRTTKLDGLVRPSNQALHEVPRQPVVYRAVRFRLSDDLDQTAEEPELVDLADLGVTSPQETLEAGVPNGSATSAMPCCEGGRLELRCKICPKSPTYWCGAVQVGGDL